MVDLFVRSWVEIPNSPPEGLIVIVDLFVRSWVEISISTRIIHHLTSTSSWGRELKCEEYPQSIRFHMSTSSWGRELKSYTILDCVLNCLVDLFVRSWVEICIICYNINRNKVDLFVRSWVEIILTYFTAPSHKGRPLREVVSWNHLLTLWYCYLMVDLFVRSWVEILIPLNVLRLRPVDLFVRSWVEIEQEIRRAYMVLSTSSWGRELKCCVWWNRANTAMMSTSSWGRELKYVKYVVKKILRSRPLREVVSWNISTLTRTAGKTVDLFVRSWVEIMKFFFFFHSGTVDLFVRSWVEIAALAASIDWKAGRPLREVVSWNVAVVIFSVFVNVDLFVRSWVEIFSDGK